MNLNALEQIAKQFANDIKEYVALGGTLNDLCASKVYGLIFNNKTVVSETYNE